MLKIATYNKGNVPSELTISNTTTVEFYDRVNLRQLPIMREASRPIRTVDIADLRHERNKVGES